MTTGEITKNTQDHPFWTLSVSEVTELLKTNIQNGISEKEAEKRLKIFGLNIIEKPRRSPGLLILLNQFKSPLILILIFAGIVTLFINHYRDSIFIFIAVFINTILGFYQEYKAEKALAELNTYLKQRTRVIRDEKEYEIDAVNLVPGDIIRLAQGDRSPADCRMIYTNDFQVDESILTGESLPVTKTINPVKIGSVLGDQYSMIFAGTLVTQGIGTAIVCRTDYSTELGKIATLVAESNKEETPLQRAIRHLSTQAGIFLGILTLVIFFIGISLGYSKIDMFLTSVAIAVSAVPEGLPIAMTVILAIGVQRMAKRKGVIRRLMAAEALGGATIILTDKTGTLTMAKMSLNKILPTNGMDEKELLSLALINSNVLIENKKDPIREWRMSGRTLEIALVQSSAMRNIYTEEIKSKNLVLSYMPFNAVNKFSVSLVRRSDGKHILNFFGAPENFIHHSNLDHQEKEKYLNKIDSLARQGEFVVGVATKEIEPKEDFTFSKDLDLTNLSFNGFITLHDPIRPGVKEAIQRVELAGIKTIIVTGDHRGTAESIAKEVGMHPGKENVLDTVVLRTLSDDDLRKQLPFLKVISRVSPTDKMRIVKLFQESGEIVAMTGDGVNDSPGIKQADIGIAMGSGTAVARDVADLILLDDNFETIVSAVEEGRQIMHNIRKVLVYLLSDVTDELFLIGGSLITGLPLPLNALQILYVNFFSDSFPAIAFAFEKNIDGFSSHPHKSKNGLFNPLVKFLILFIGISTSAFLFFLYWFLLRAGYQEDFVKTFIFASFSSYTLFLAFSMRSLEKNIFKYPIFSNLYLTFGVSIGLLLIIAAIYVPFLQSLLDTVALPIEWLVGVILVGLLSISLVEFAKWIFNQKKNIL